jgi:hypothetical protein
MLHDNIVLLSVGLDSGNAVLQAVHNFRHQLFLLAFIVATKLSLRIFKLGFSTLELGLKFH